jgi:hypothetical protein
LPSFDAYGKVGVARFEESFDVYVSDWSLPCRLQPFGQAPSCLFISQGGQTDSHPYVGIGVRFKESGRAWAVRLEYEAIDGELGDTTTMLSVGIAWER